MTKLFTLAALLLTLPVSLMLSTSHALLATASALAQTADAQQSEAVGEALRKADRLNQQGVEQAGTGQVEAAIQSFQQAAAIYHTIHDLKGEEAVQGNLGILYANQGDYARAIASHKQALALAQTIPYPKGEGAELGNLGVVYYALGEYAEAIESHLKALAIAQKINDSKGEAADLANLGNAYYALADYDKASDYYRQSLAIKQKIGDRRGEGRTLNALALVQYQKGDYDQTVPYLQQALAIGQALHDPQILGASWRDLGRVALDLGKYDKAIEYEQQVLDIGRQTNDPLSQGVALSNLGAAFFKAGQLAKAERALRDSVQLWESLRAGLGNNDANKVSIFETQTGTYQLLQQVLVTQNKSDAALEIAERGRARAFVELLAGNLGNQPETTRQLTLTPPTLPQIQQIAKAAKATLVTYSIINTERRSDASALYIWVIQPTGAITFRQADLKRLSQQRTALQDLVLTSRDAIGARGLSVRGATLIIPTNLAILQQNPTIAQKKLQQLHQLLIDPIADLLPTDPNAHVIFMPQGALFLVPFPALQAANGKYLIEQHTLSTASSIQALDLTRQQQRMRNREAGTGKALIVGNPTMPLPDLMPLPNAEAEANAIAKSLGTAAITGKQATKAAIVQKMPQASIIHLATHGLLDDIRGLGSAIALAPDPGKPAAEPLGRANGLLTAQEILGMKLKAALVVLSACDTGRGRITGDGVIGLSRSFSSAGVPSVMVSLWSVPDAPTADLMKDFYQNWQAKHLDKAQALRQAMLDTMKTHHNPIDWAAFTLIGEAQ